MRKLIIIFFILLLLLYAGCAVCVLFDLYGWDVYFKIVAIVGGLASIIGLGAAAFIRVDLLSYDAEAIERLAVAAKEIEDKNTKIKDASDQIASLEYKKEELEVLVKKASLILYYKEELDRKYQKLLALINKNEDLNQIVLEIPQLEENLKNLEGEMEENKEIQDILSTIQKAKGRYHFPELVINTFFGSFPFK